MLRRLFLSVLGSLLIVTPSWAQVRIAPKLVEGRESRSEANIEVKQVLSIAGMDIDSSSTNRIVSSSKSGKRDGAGQISVAETIEQMQVNISTMGMEYAFDSNTPDKAGTSGLESALRGLHKATCNRTTVKTYDKDGQVVSVELKPDVLSTLSEDARAAVGDSLSPESMKKEAIQNLVWYPKSEVAKGDTWRISERRNLGSGQIMTFEVQYSYGGTVTMDGVELDQIASKVLEVDFALENSPLPFTVKGVKLKATESKGAILFDRKAGHVVSQTNASRIQGTMEFTINNQDLPVKLDLKFSAKTSLLK